MKHQMFAIHDSKARAYLPPFILPNKEMAIRVFKDCINNPEHQFSKNPGDYTIFQLGHYLDTSGKIEVDKTQLSLGNGVQFVDQIPLDLEDQPRLFDDPPIGNVGKLNNADLT